MRLTVRVRPGASRNRVGGVYGETGALIVAVTAPAVDGKATEAVVAVVAAALDVRRGDVQVVAGATSRTKILQVPDECSQRVAALFEA